MGKIAAFLNIERADHEVRPADESIKDHDEYIVPLTLEEQCEQASRCMNCGVAFCQSGITFYGDRQAVGCPLHNLIPETNDLLYRRRFDDALERLSLTNPFPEFTGRVCPAPCEIACNLGLNKEPVTINDNERALSDLAWELEKVRPLEPPASDAPVASIIGSGPAGLTCAWELARKGWRVRVYERSDRPGGLLMYGIPNMKLPKWVIDRRVDLMKESGIEFICGFDAVENSSEIADHSDVVIIATGANIARDVDIEGRDLEGIHFALDYLSDITCALLENRDAAIDAKDKDVVVIGGGDTGIDCIACALRQGAKSVTQVIRAKKPPEHVDGGMIWPSKRVIYTQGYGQREAEELFGEDPRLFSKDTIAFVGNEHVEGVVIQDISYDGERYLIDGTENTIPAQLVLIAKGFTGTENAIFEAFGVEAPVAESETHRLQNIENSSNSANAPVFIAGDAANGATLVVNAMADAIDCVEEIAGTFEHRR